MNTIRKIVKKGDYYYGVCPEHPSAIDHGYVLLHRLIMENLIGRRIEEWEVVHHIDGNKKNNSPENLQVMELAEHTRMHSTTGRTYVDRTCASCGVAFKLDKRNAPFRPGKYCSKPCAGNAKRRNFSPVSQTDSESLGSNEDYPGSSPGGATFQSSPASKSEIRVQLSAGLITEK